MTNKLTPEKAVEQIASLNYKTVFSPDYWANLLRDASSSIITALSQILLILALFLLVRLAVFKVIDRILIPMANRESASGETLNGRASRIMTLQGLVKSVAAYTLGFIAGIMILRAIGVDPIPALTTAGVAALAVGFGAQLLVRDVITGFFILLENQYAVGDYVTVGTVTGTVEEIGMRITRLRDDVGKLVVLANGTVSQVINHSRGALLATLEVSIAAGSDTQKAVEVFNRTGEALDSDRSDVFSPFRCEGIVAMDAAKVTFKLAGRVAPTRQEDVLMDLRARIRQSLMDEGIALV